MRRALNVQTGSRYRSLKHFADSLVRRFGVAGAVQTRRDSQWDGMVRLIEERDGFIRSSG